MQTRFKSLVLWASLAAQILSILVILGVITPTQSEMVNGIITAMLQAFVAFGVLNNPTNPEGF